MNMGTVKVQEITATPSWRQVIRSRLPSGLTIAERKFLLGFVDLALLNGSLLVVTMIWHDLVLSTLSILVYAKWFITLSVVWWGFSNVFDIYDLALSASTTSILRNVAVATFLTTFVYVWIPWLTPRLNARAYAGVLIVLSEVAIVSWRIGYAQALCRSAFWRRVLVLGTGDTARKLMADLNGVSQAQDANPFRGTGYEIVGLVAAEDPLPQRASGDGVLGDFDQLVRLARRHRADEIIVALDDQCTLSPPVFQVLLDCRELGLTVRPVVEVYERLTARLPVEYARDDLQALWDRKEIPSARLYLAIRGLMDWLFALLGIVALALLLPWVALGNALWSPGPLFYRQVRVGKGGKPFMLVKFRSMLVNAEQLTGATWSLNNDQRITPVGRWLRKTRLDELPQVLNVLRGEMSMIGPRPERPHFVGKLTQDLPVYRIRNAIKPGLTGWAQVRYEYADSVEDSRVKLEYDLYYIKHASLYLDLLITLQTLSVMLRLRGK